jgi:quinoprotein glucose dehydrogenase
MQYSRKRVVAIAAATHLLRGLFGGLLALFGLALGLGGAWLTSLGGSAYYLLAGIGCMAAGVLVCRARMLGLWVFLAVLLGTVFWALAEVGLHFWLLLPRIGVPLAIAAVFALPWTRRQLGGNGGTPARYAMSAGVAFGTVLMMASLAANQSVLIERSLQNDTFASSVVAGSLDEWTAYGRTPAGTRYSPDTQVTPANVRRLELAWDYRTGDLRSALPHLKAMFSFEATPLEIDDTLYFCTPLGNVVALDGDSGKLKWRFDAKVDVGDAQIATCRGVSYHNSRADTHECPERLFVATVDDRLIAVDRNSGQRCRDFGVNGEISLREGLGKTSQALHYTTSPPAIIGNAVVVGSYVRDNLSTDEPSGVVRAYDVHSGKLLWAFDAGRGDGAPPLTPGATYARNSPNAWSILSADPSLGLVYIPLGNATPDAVGMHRSALDERYSSSVVAVDAATGRVRWFFQTTHHDLWDYDIPAEPVLFDMPSGDHTVPAVAVPTKRGEIFILDRRDGKPLTAVAERPVPQGNIPGEKYSPTQPYSVGFPSFAPPPLREQDMWGTTPLDQLWCRIEFRSVDYRGNFTPPSVGGSIEYPGNFGVINWGGVSIDEGRRLMIVGSTSMPQILKLIPRNLAAGMSEDADAHLGFHPQLGTPYGMTYLPMLSPIGVPCHAPPWGMLSAVDLRTRQILWQRPLGTTRDRAPLEISIPGVFAAGGSVVTQGGLIFIAATLDDYLRAFDVNSGKEVWRGRLPAGGQATPMTYTSSRTGRQYVIVAAGGNEFLGTTLGDHVVAFTLGD